MAGDANYANVSLLLHGDGANNSTVFTDSAITPKTITPAGNAKISTTQSKFGGSSIYLDGTGDSLSTPCTSDFSFGTSDFTIEAWVYIAADSAVDIDGTKSAALIAANYPSGGSISNTWGLSISGNTSVTGTALSVTVFNWSSTITNCVANVSISKSAWHHVAFSRKYGVGNYLFLDGTLLTNTTNTLSTSAAVNTTTTNPIRVGTTGYSGYLGEFNGYIDDLRITKGVARYTASFTPPAAAFPDGIAQVSGTVEDSTGTPASRTVRAYRRDTGAFLKEGVSTSGSYTLNLPYAGEVNVICLDDVAGTTENDLILRTTAS